MPSNMAGGDERPVEDATTGFCEFYNFGGDPITRFCVVPPRTLTPKRPSFTQITYYSVAPSGVSLS